MGTACAATAPTPSASRSASRPASYALHLTWQRADAFNEPLSFDTSKVTSMENIFEVHSSSVLA